MNLLICTQKVDKKDSILGFFHAWIAEFAKHCESVTVVCLEKGDFELPVNVRVLSLGKEQYTGKTPSVMSYRLWVMGAVARIGYILKFYSYIFSQKENYDKIFVHMNSEYVVLGGLFWRMWKKKIALWYVHKGLPWQLRIAEKLVDVIFTASPESCRLQSRKIKVVGHGIDINQFPISNFQFPIKSQIQNPKSKILYVGRISPMKNQLLLLEALDILVNQKGVKDIKVRLVGAPHMGGDGDYLDGLKSYVNGKGLGEYVEFAGAVPNTAIAGEYAAADLAVNLCPTGGMDKAVLEALAAGLPVLVLNRTFEGLLGGRGEFLLDQADAEALALKIAAIKSGSRADLEAVLAVIKENIHKNHGLEALVGRMVSAIG